MDAGTIIMALLAAALAVFMAICFVVIRVYARAI